MEIVWLFYAFFALVVATLADENHMAGPRRIHTTVNRKAKATKARLAMTLVISSLALLFVQHSFT